MNNAKTNEHNEWVPVANAARILGVSKQAIRQRIYRNTIPNRKQQDGKVYVRITGNNPETNGENTSESHYGNTAKTNVENNGESYAENTGDTGGVSRELIDELRDRLAFTERQLEQANERDSENRRIIAGLVQRVPELEAAADARDAPEWASEHPGKGVVPPEQQEPTERRERSWWRAFFGLE